MKKQMIRLGLTFGMLAGATAAAAVGCGTAAGTPGPSGSSSGTASGTNATSGTATGSSTTGTATTGTASGTGTTTPDAGGPLGSVALDDMTMQQSPLGGSWYTYSDRTEANSEPPIILGGVPGTMMPDEGASFFSTMPPDPKAPSLAVMGAAAMPFPFRECSGSGNDNWGAGFGLDLTDATPDGGPVVFNSCVNDAGVNGKIFDNTGASPNVGIPIPFNAKTAGYTGIAFYGTSFAAGAQSVNVQMDDERTSPWGGLCNACQNGGKCSVGSDGGQNCPCSDNFIYTALFPAGSWKQFSFHFTDKTLATANWSTQGLPKGGIDTTSLYNLHFQITTSVGKALPAYDLGVAYISWLTD